MCNLKLAAVGLILEFSPPQTSMSVVLTMVGVLTAAPTTRALSRAAVEVDSSWQVMEGAVMVRHSYVQSEACSYRSNT